MSKKKYYKANPRIKAVEVEEKVKNVDRFSKEDIVPLKKCWVVAENRIGSFNVSTAMLEFIEWEVYQELIKNFMITASQISPDKTMIQYLAFSPLFDKLSRLEPDGKPPQYKINIKVDPPAKEKGKKRVVVTAKKLPVSKITKVSKIVDSKGQQIKL